MLNEKSGLVFLSILPSDESLDDSNTQDIQTAIQWDIIDRNLIFSSEQELNKEWTAYTLINLLNKDIEKITEISDLSESQFQQQVQQAVDCGLMTIDSHKKFYPKDPMDKDEAEALLDKVVSMINDREIKENKTNINWKEDTQFFDVEPITYEEEGQWILVDPTVQYEQGQVLHFQQDGEDLYYQVDHQEQNHVYLKDIDLLEYTKDMDISGSTDLNFEDAKIEDGSGETIQEYSYVDPITLLSTRGLQKTFHISEYNVVVSATSSYVKAEVNRTLPHGSTVYAYTKLSGAKVDYQWKSEENDVKDAYFKVKFSSEESFGVKNSAYKNLYGDFSKVDPNDFLPSISKMFVEKQDVVESTLELCKVKLPIPNAPLMNITVTLNLNIHASGKVEVTLSQDSVIGCEIKGDRFRMIREFDHDESNRFKATSGISAGVNFGLNLTSMRLMDASLNAGAEASFKTSLHLYKDDEHDVVTTDIGSDVVEELSDGNPNVMVCSDLNANLVLYLKLNSAKSQLGKIGFTKRIDLIKQSMLPKGKTHLENFQFVSKCTRKDREKQVTMDSLTVTKKIKLSNYSMAVHVNKAKTIDVIGLPEGYTKEDLIYSSSNEDVAKVDTSGNVIGKAAGSCVITISTSDEEHYIKCNIIVSEVNS